MHNLGGLGSPQVSALHLAIDHAGLGRLGGGLAAADRWV